MKIRSLTHHDLDGVVSVINIMNAVGFKSDYKFRSSGYGKIDKFISEIESDVDLLFITDLNYTEEQIRTLSTKNARKIIYLDHHNYNFDLKALCSELGIIHRYDNTKCGSIITYEYLNEIPQVSMPHLYELNRITNIYDLWQKDDPEFLSLAHPLNDLFWEYNTYKFIDKFKNGYHLDFEDETVIQCKSKERKDYLELSMKSHSIINEEQRILMVMNPNTNFTNDFTLFFPDFDIYLMLSSNENKNFQFSLRISNDINLTIKEVYSKIEDKLNFKMICGGHEKAGGVTIPQDKFSEFMEAFNSSIEEWRKENDI